MDPAQFSVRINAGGTVAAHGFGADNSYEGGSAVASQGQAVSGTDMNEVFSSVRHQNFAYRIPVPAAGEYSVELLFAEFWRDPGQRVFRAEIEGISTPDIDIAAAVGRGAAHSVASTVTVSDGVLDIAFVPVSDDNPMVSALSVTATSTATFTRDLYAQVWSNEWPLTLYRHHSSLIHQGGREGDVLVVSSLAGRILLRRRLHGGQGSVRLPADASNVLLCHIERNGSRVQVQVLP